MTSLAFGLALPAHSQVFKTQEQALQDFFASADTVIRKTLFLSAAQKDTLEARSQSSIDSRVISYYMGRKNDQIIGYAFFDKKIVRTKEAFTMTGISAAGVVERVEVLAFLEPQDYLPIERWFALFIGKSLTSDLWPGRQIHSITGATLSVRAFTFSVRRALAVYGLIGATTR